MLYLPTLPAPLTTNSRLARHFDPSPNLAAQGDGGWLVDEVVLFVWPVIFGGRNPALHAITRAHLELLDERRFNSGVIRGERLDADPRGLGRGVGRRPEVLVDGLEPHDSRRDHGDTSGEPVLYDDGD